MTDNLQRLQALPRGGPQPLYQQIKSSILKRIDSGAWQPGERLPSENALVGELRVSRMTITRALRELTQEGLLRRVPGIGTFVASPPRHATLLELHNIADEIRARGSNYHAEVLEHSEQIAIPAVATWLELPAGSPVFHAVLVHYQDEQPLQLEDRYVNPNLAPDFLRADLTEVTPTQYLVELYRPDEMEHQVSAMLPTPDECRYLAVEAQEPCLRLQRRTWKNGSVVTRVSLLYPGSRYQLAARYSTDSYRRST
jgi:GntR family histidine utilization transcriptional repressor